MTNIDSSFLGLPPGLNSPKESIIRLVNTFLPYSNEVEKCNHYEIGKNINGFYILTKGYVDVCHTRSGWTISTIHAPYIIGIGIIHGAYWHGYLRLSKYARICFVSLDSIPTDIFSDNSNVWKDISAILSFHLQYAGYRDSILSLRSSYPIIKSKLIELSNMPNEIKINITVINYIVNSTSLSKSIIARTLRDLRSGRYIEMKNGTLLRVNSLPRGY
jgi:hypothetical protein